MLVAVRKRESSLCCLCLAASLLGCSSLDSQKKQRDPFADAEEGGKEKDLSLDFVTKAVRQATGRGPNREVAYKLFGEGQGLYSEAIAQRSKDAGAARKVFATAGEKFAKAADRWPDSALEEEALYLAGESRFFADRYPEAEDSFERLLKTHPRTQYLDLVQARRFAIARYWLDLEEKQQESFFAVNVTDDSRPWRDTFGHSMRVFDRIRLDDPTGKLADDATLALGNAYFAQSNFIKADEYYTDLRKTFPSSEHQFNAHFLGLKAKLESYEGAEYSGSSLDEADKLLRQVVRQFPVEAQKEREFLARIGGEIRFRQAEREWHRGSFYERRSEFGAARLHYDKLVSDFSDTPFAKEASQRVAAIADRPDVPPQRFEWLVDLFPERETVRPLVATQPNASGNTVRR